MSIVNLRLAALLLALPLALQARVRVAEIVYDPEGDDGGAEWVELLNTGEASVALGGWLLDAAGPNLLLPEIALPAGATLLVHVNAEAAQPPQGLEIWIENAVNMGNTHGFVGLWRGEEQTVDALEDWVQWGSDGHSWQSQAVEAGVWPDGIFLPDVESGHSLRLAVPELGADGWVDDPQPVAGDGETALAEPALRPGDSPRLSGAWPNPFNPTSRVGFELPRTARIRLGLHDLLGREVLRLEDGLLPAGHHERSVDLGARPGGPYFVVLEAEGTRSVMKLLLLR